MQVKEYRELQRMGFELYSHRCSGHRVDAILVAKRLKKNPETVMRMSARDPRLVEKWNEYAAEIQPVKVNVSGKAPWVVRLDDTCKDCAIVCTCRESSADILCEVRDTLFSDLEVFIPELPAGPWTGIVQYRRPNEVEVLTGLTSSITDDWEWAVYRSVAEVVRRTRFSPLARWNSQERDPSP